MKNWRRIIAATMAATMVLGSTLVVCAEDADVSDPEAANANVEAEGQLEAFVSKDVFKIVLPTVTAEDLKFAMDPQGLLYIADDSTYKTEKGAVYFVENDADKTASPEIVVKNKSSFDVDVTLDFDVKLADGITLVDKATALTDATVPSLYLSVISDVEDAEATTIGEKTKVVDTLEDIEYTFDVKTEATAGYVQGNVITTNYYGYIPADSDASNDITYVISGSCDSTADWSNIKDATSSVDITWKVDKHSDLKPTVESGISGDGTKYYYTPTVKATSVISIEVYDVTTGEKLGDVPTSAASISATTGNVAITKSNINAVKGSSTKLAVAVTTNAGSDVFTIG